MRQNPGCKVALQPVSASHESVVQLLPSSQTSAVPGAQAPFWHISMPLHTLLSEQLVPFARGLNALVD
jgi:hypothetical protein